MEYNNESHDRRISKRSKIQRDNEVQTMLDSSPQVQQVLSLPSLPKKQTEQEIDDSSFTGNQQSVEESRDQENRRRSNESNSIDGPSLDLNQSAATFFSNAFFYHGKEASANDESNVENRKTKFGNKTVKAVLMEIPSPLHIYKYFSSIVTSGAERIETYWYQLNSSIEQKLDQKILYLSNAAEIELIENRYVNLDYSTYTPLHEGTDDRINDVCIVLGTSGSGKTFFSVKKAAKFNPSANDLVKVEFSTTVHLYASDFMDAILRNQLSQAISKEICFGDTEFRQLRMHISVIIDEAGGEKSRHFEKVTNLNKIFHDLKRLAIKVRLIVTGTGLTAEELNSISEVKKYRMTAWSAVNVKKVAEERFPDLPLCFLDFVHTRPNLNALTTNARAAWFLLQALRNYAQIYSYPRDNEIGNDTLVNEIKSDLYNLTSSIESTVIPQVAAKYIEGNGLKNLTPPQRRCVAAMIFSEVEKAAQAGEPTLPNFSSYYTEDLKEQIVANSLISVNVEFINGKLQFVEKNKRSLLLSPAITIVLFHLLGVKVGVLSSWKGLEVMIGLHAFRKIAISTISQHEDCSKMLQQVKLRKLSARIPEPRAEAIVKIPRLGASTVWINGDMAPFADIVAPNFLFQCKHTEQKTSQITCNLYNELSKCGVLLNDLSDRGKIGWATLNAIMKDWEGGMVSAKVIEHNMDGQERAHASKKFYPEAQIKIVEADMDAGIEFVSIPVNQSDASYLTAEVKVELKYVLSTNADTLKLTFKGRSAKQKWAALVTAGDVDEDGKLINQSDWDHIFSRIRKNVMLRFYFV